MSQVGLNEGCNYLATPVTVYLCTLSPEAAEADIGA